MRTRVHSHSFTDCCPRPEPHKAAVCARACASLCVCAREREGERLVKGKTWFPEDVLSAGKEARGGLYQRGTSNFSV